MPSRQAAPKNTQKITSRHELSADNSAAAPRVLIVDDDPGMRLLLGETLSRAGFLVAEAESGLGAIELCPEFEPDLVLLDINMPKMDGITTCAEIRRHSLREFPIIMVTSVDDADSIQNAFDAGASDFILKPVNWPLFQRRLDTVLQEWHRSRETDTQERRVRLLEKVVPDRAMLISRKGEILEDLKHRGDSAREGLEPPAQSLSELYGDDIGKRLQQRISGVLKTGRHNSLSFVTGEAGEVKTFDAQFLVEGRDRVIVVVQDVSEDRESQGEIYDLAFSDSSTTLPNRHLFNRAAEEILTDARLQGRPLALFSLCLDQVSDDDLADSAIMSTVADRLSSCLANIPQVAQLADGGRAARIARVEANRFMFFMLHNPIDDQTGSTGDRIMAALAEPLPSGSGQLTLAPRIGVALYPSDGRELDVLVHAAGLAMAEATETGQLLCYNAETASRPIGDHQDYGDELRQAIENGQLELHFQPRLSGPGGNVSCIEALLRWNHPIRGYVDLRELLYLAKATGLIVPLGDWVLQHACEAAQRWRSPVMPRLSINLSQQEFSRQDLAERLLAAVEKSGIDPARIELELTESALLRAADSVAELESLKGLGVGLVLDDFGTGHTSLASLKQYPLDALKIDASFVQGLPGEQRDAAVCEVIITMAHLFGMQAVAEGIESRQQMQALVRMGCDEFQGFYVCKPLPADEIQQFLDNSGRPGR